MATNRRSFLKQGTAVTLGALPTLVYRGSTAAETRPTKDNEKILVVIQMSGGNDGINTVVPFADEGYAKHRSKLRLPTERLIKINDSVGLHPSMRSAADLLEDGKLAIIQGVGYPNPSRSHDVSMATWHSAQVGDADTVRTHGWLGRAMDAATGNADPTATNDPQMVLLGDENQPLAIQSRRSTAITLSNLSDLRLKTPLHLEGGLGLPHNSLKRRQPGSDDLSGSLPSVNSLAGFIQQTMHDATAASNSLEQSIDKGSVDDTAYPSTKLGQRMQSISTLIKSDFGTPVYYTIQSGYDTHAAQLFSHARLLREFSGSMKAFMDDLSAAGLSDRVCVMGFSEFGRRVAENGSEGTDHGTAGPAFIAGENLNPGMIGKTPSLLDLVNGDLPMSVDFRSVYHEVTRDWLGLKSVAAKPGDQPPLRIFDV